MRSIIVITLMVVGLLCVSCDLEEEITAKYTIDGRHIRCHNVTDTSNYQSGDYQSYTCVWHCATYKGKKKRYVSLTFRWEGYWYLQSEYISSGICQSMGVALTQP